MLNMIVQCHQNATIRHENLERINHIFRSRLLRIWQQISWKIRSLFSLFPTRRATNENSSPARLWIMAAKRGRGCTDRAELLLSNAADRSFCQSSEPVIFSRSSPRRYHLIPLRKNPARTVLSRNKMAAGRVSSRFDLTRSNWPIKHSPRIPSDYGHFQGILPLKSFPDSFFQNGDPGRADLA